ncbi:MAG: thiol-disulfide oxidoreductase DCC family protein [Pseudomonadales bacterium]
MANHWYRGQPIPDQLILFDGVCNFCSASVRFVIRRDQQAHFQFASLQSDVGQHFAQRYSFTNLESMVLLQRGQIYQKSSAALRVARQLTGMWPLLYTFVVIPEPIRDYVYDFIGNRRYRWFGKTEECWMPKPDIERRFFQ